MEENEISFTAANVMKAEAELPKSGVLLPCFRKHFRKDEMIYKIIFFSQPEKYVFHSLQQLM